MAFQRGVTIFEVIPSQRPNSAPKQQRHRQMGLILSPVRKLSRGIGRKRFGGQSDLPAERGVTSS